MPCSLSVALWYKVMILGRMFVFHCEYKLFNYSFAFLVEVRSSTGYTTKRDTTNLYEITEVTDTAMDMKFVGQIETSTSEPQ
jgi:hypothetical protein